MPDISVIIPVLNESRNIPLMVERLTHALAGVDWEAVFVDDDSLDGSAAVARAIATDNPRIRVIQRIGRQGLASAAIEGMLATSSPWLAVMDGDLQHDESILPRMLEAAKAGDLDLVVASRHIAGGGVGEFSESRVRLSNLGRSLIRLVMTCPLSDPMSGYFLVSRGYLDEVVHDLSQLGFKILADLAMSATRPIRVTEVPFTFRSRQFGEIKLDTNVGIEFLLLLADKLVGRIVPVRYILYSLVGLLGVLVHMSALWILHAMLGAPALTSQTAATILALTCNFFLNNSITYRDAKLRGWARIARGYAVYAAACGIGVFANLGVFNLLTGYGVFWLFAGLAGMTISSAWNFGAASVFTWKLARRQRASAAKGRRPAGDGG